MSQTQKTLGGYVCVRNGNDLDYCWGLAIQSLLPVCDEVFLVDAESTDGTLEAAQRLADREPKLKVVSVPWEKPIGDKDWWVKFLNKGRSFLSTDLQITLDADEVLSNDPTCHAAIRDAVADGRPRKFDRINFWRDCRSTIPPGKAIGKWVVRMGDSKFHMPSDEGHSLGELPIIDQAIFDPRLVILHLGFLRKREKFFKKAKVVLAAFFGENGYDPRLAKLEESGEALHEVQGVDWTDSLVPWSGHIPDAVQLWLAERGHDYDKFLPKIETATGPRIMVVDEKPQASVHVLHSGDLGDIIAGMSVMKRIGRVKVFVSNRGITKPIVERFHLIKDLLISQPYVESAEIYNGEPIHWNASDFRHNYSKTTTLAFAHAQHFRGRNIRPITYDQTEPWITVEPDEQWRGKVIINRSPRYHNENFPWREIVSHYGSHIVFIGLKQEHEAFCRDFGNVAYHATNNLLECARMIAASALFIGNQSACANLAEAMKHPRILEGCLFRADCVYPGATNAQYIFDGALKLPSLNGTRELVTPSNINKVLLSQIAVTNEVPPSGGWKYDAGAHGIKHRSSLDLLSRDIARMMHMDKDVARREIIRYTITQHPNFFTERINTASFDMAVAALKGAGITECPFFDTLSGKTPLRVI